LCPVGHGGDLVAVSEQLLKTGEAARQLGLSAQRVRQLVDDDAPTAVATPYGLLFRPADVEALAKRRAEKAQAGR
jgi:hypothetical protein